MWPVSWTELFSGSTSSHFSIRVINKSHQRMSSWSCEGEEKEQGEERGQMKRKENMEGEVDRGQLSSCSAILLTAQPRTNTYEPEFSLCMYKAWGCEQRLILCFNWSQFSIPLLCPEPGNDFLGVKGCVHYPTSAFQILCEIFAWPRVMRNYLQRSRLLQKEF